MPERFERLKSVVLGARGLDGAARAAFLSEACGADEELRREAETLLAHANDDPAVLSTNAIVRFAAPEALAGLNGAPPDAIGPYRIRRVLGEGGMGTVYEAEQVEPIRRVVALKLIRRGLDTDAVIARFKTERQALALMDHPAIARVLDAGASADDRPYFVMELVEGVPITQYCRERQLGVRDTVQLFLAVCQGVRHAHQKGIVHRDLKPSNVLVRDTDGVPAPKIIDFGIAKAIDASGAESDEPITHAGRAIGTPDYMSPEQAGVIADGVDTRTDVYSLGVLLYEILTDRRPYAVASATPSAIARVLRGPEPPPPSAAAPDRRRQLAGDLDNVVARALARQPADRYASVEQFADDLRRHLDGEPVLAREATWRYRATKFVRRHTAAVAVAATLAVLVAGAAVAFAIQARRLAAERDRAVAAEQRARAQTTTAESVTSFLVDLLQMSNPSKARGESITVREVLDRGTQRIEADLKDQPEVQATLLGTMGLVYQSLGQYKLAESLHERALARRRQIFGAEHAAVAESTGYLAHLHRLRGDFAGAESLLREALAIYLRTLGREHPSTAFVMGSLGGLLASQGQGHQLAEAESLARDVLDIRLRLLTPDHYDLAAARMELATVLLRKADLAGAEDQIRQALELDRRGGREINRDVSIRWYRLGQILRTSGRLADAESAMRKSLEIARKLHGDEDHPDIAHTSRALAGLLIDQGQAKDAEPLLETALDLHRRLLGETHFWVVTDLQGLGRVRLIQRKYAEAERVFRQALSLATTNYKPESIYTIESAMNLGSVLRRQGRLAEAEPILRNASALYVKTQGAGLPFHRTFLWELASAVAARGNPDEAETLARQALDIHRKSLPSQSARPAGVLENPGTLLLDPTDAASLASLGTLLLDRGDPQAAAPLLRGAVAAYREAGAPIPAAPTPNARSRGVRLPSDGRK